MSKWWELNPKQKPDGKYEFQDAEGVVVTALSEEKLYGNAIFQDCAILTADGMRSIPASFLYFKDSKDRFQISQLNQPIDLKVKVEPDQRTPGATKYTLMIPNKRSGGGSGYGGGRGGYKPDPRADYRKQICMLYSYAKDLVIGDKLQLDLMGARVGSWLEEIEMLEQAKFGKPDDGIPV